MSILRAARALDIEHFDDKMQELHVDVMGTLAQMFAREDGDGHCELCHGTCVKQLLPGVGLTSSELRGASLQHYLRTLDLLGLPGEMTLALGNPITSLERCGPPMPLDFALIAHQESWSSHVLAVLRGPGRTPIPDDDLKDIFPWFPPRAICHIDHRPVLGHSVHGIYIDSFIPPDRLGRDYRAENIGRVRDAAACAIKAGARIVSLGGFSSILIEGDSDLLPEKGETVFTTGNTLTVAFVVRGVKKACALQGRDMSKATLLIVGATGDVGSGCARCLAPLVHRVILNARNIDRLRSLAEELSAGGTAVDITTDLQQLSARADIVICVASLESPSLLLAHPAPTRSSVTRVTRRTSHRTTCWRVARCSTEGLASQTQE